MTVKQAANVLDLFEFFARTRRPATLSEIAQTFGWPRSSTFNLVGTLVERGFLYEPKTRGGYYPTPRWLSMAETIASAEPLPESLHGLLVDLARTSGETAHVAAAAGLSVVFVDVVESQSDIRYFATIGKRIPIQAAATGRAILAQYSPAARTAILKKVRYERYQPSSPMSAEEVETEIVASMARGWFQSQTEFTPDVMGVGVPLPIAGRRLSIAVGGPTFRLAPRLPEMGAMLRETVSCYLTAHSADLNPGAVDRKFTTVHKTAHPDELSAEPAVLRRRKQKA